MRPYLGAEFGDPSSLHTEGRSARAAVERAGGHVASLVGARADQVVFTSGGTEANNLALASVTGRFAERAHVVTSAIAIPATWWCRAAPYSYWYRPMNCGSAPGLTRPKWRG